ncbi:MAG: 3-hydroxyacyl-CoA dehydrogenase NAD-binding domain-containing protein [Rickettsiales bacterium]|nr:3-hydroxyacyl-CoA dehydrogenase NAD-binding domain-containing protein [Rickettsiales bacterium]
MQSEALTLKIEKNGVANLVFDLPDEKVNKLSKPVLIELEKAINVIDGNKAIRVLIITSAKKDIFIAGADINEIKAITDLEDALEKVARGQNILHKISQLKIPTIAVIDGACLGGGLELALACQYRVAIVDKKTMLGLPEVNLGIIPGFGGTQRLPKLIGLQEALKIILSGKAVDARKAFKIGLVDDLAREEFLSETLSKFVNEILQNNNHNKYLETRKAAKKKRWIFENLFLGKFLIFFLSKKDVLAKTKGQYPAPIKALEVVKKTYGSKKLQAGLAIELNEFCQLVTGDIAKNLIEIFFTNEALKKDLGVEDKVETIAIKNVGLLGAGVMGGGIAWLFSNYDIDIRIKDIAWNAVALGYKQVMKIYNQLKKIKKYSSTQIEIKTAKITSSLDYTGFENVDFVIEAVVENIDIKKKILLEAEKQIKKDAIIVSNTSSLSISQMAQALQNPERFAGMHFFNPVNRMPLVEVIRGEKTSDKTIATIVKLAKKLGKTPIVVKDSAGFVVNRILLPYMNEAAFLLQEGAEIQHVDLLIENFGMPMGPFILADIVGIDVGVKVAHSLHAAFGEHMQVAEILDEIYTNHKDLLGKKSGSGFYLYGKNDKTPTQLNPKLATILSDLRKSKNIARSTISESEIVDRCILIMINEAAKCLEENIIKNARYLDMAMIMGAGFPAFRGGILRLADSYGIKKVVEDLQKFSQKYSRFSPCALLIKMAQSDQSFYENY